MSYVKAEDILPRELIEAIQQYVDGRSIYIPTKERQDWGTKTDTRRFLKERNEEIYESYMQGLSSHELAVKYALSIKSVQRILRNQRMARMDRAE
ncbi:MAG TPA: hypothetical protein DCL29_00910 [Eubacterium sp.]|nr:hypothetical protein [Eubacterium sp.]